MKPISNDRLILYVHKKVIMILRNLVDEDNLGNTGSLQNTAT